MAQLGRYDEECGDMAQYYPDSGLVDQQQLNRRLSALRITAIYLVAGALWILFSDRLLAALTANPDVLTRVGTFKGWFYVLATGVLLYALIRRHEVAILRAGEVLEKRVQERTRELSTLLAVSHTVVSTLKLEPLLNVVLEQLRSVVEYNGASVLIGEGEELILRAYHGPLSPEEAFEIRVRRQQPLAREVALNRKMDGLEATRRIKSCWPEVRVIALTMHTGYRAEALAAGADAFLLKGGSVEALLAAISAEPCFADRRHKN
jgi:CheY-like chemotaxis protein